MEKGDSMDDELKQM